MSKAFTCTLDPTLDRLSLLYADDAGGEAGTATILEGGRVAVAKTNWGSFRLAPYEMGDAPSWDLLADDESHLATFFGESGEAHVRYVVRDAASAPFMLLEPIADEPGTGLSLSATDGLSRYPSYVVRSVAGHPLGAVMCAEKILKPHPARRVRCLTHTVVVAALPEGRLPDVRLIVSIPLVLATAIGDPHVEGDLGSKMMGQ